ncbi:2-dehydro-3-deoxygluconokinase [Yoonia tamlensis]|uniref:2-dehydro-3-deoxygluconokinase n=1 Tax=Yoonia tamlensis TaxID=390270 RepID=A0A1I6HKY7_9RHOB|nr:sugar kinase [Yoonia tamlensis]SFR55096.1 2-dehydro-3-deoxygluconokinase [Yoonia tamlensis]
MTTKRPIRKIACIGEVMIELIAHQDGSARVGVAGDTYNTAVYLARALRGSDITVSYVTALGTDPYSDRILTAVQSHGLDTTYIERREGQMPGLYAIDTDATGERSFSYWRSAAAARQLFSPGGTVSFDDLDGFDMVLLTGISMAILPPAVRAALLDWAQRFSAAGGTLVYDSNHRPKLWEDSATARDINTQMWQRVDIALPSADDEQALFGDAGSDAVAARLRGLGVTNGAMKRGEEGPLDLAGAHVFKTPAEPIKVVDTTAAGDSFNAGYLAAIARGQTAPEAMAAGHALAGRVIAAPGAIIPE